MTQFIGIDISKLNYTVCIKKGDSVRVAEFQNNPDGHQKMLKWVKSNSKDEERVFVMEATSTYHIDCALYLYSKGEKVAIVNPRFVHNFRKAMGNENKTDITDAQLIAHYGEVKKPKLWTPPSQSIAKLKELVQRREDILKMIRQEKNRMEALSQSSPVKKSIRKILKTLQEEFDRIEKEINDVIQQDPEIRKSAELLKSIPGIGDVVSSVILASVGDIKLFGSKHSLQSFWGVNSAVVKSGTSINKSRMSKNGSALVRKHLFMSALVASSHCRIFSEYKESLVKKGKPKKQAICAVMRKLAGIIYAVLLYQTPFSISTYYQIKQKFNIPT